MSELPEGVSIQVLKALVFRGDTYLGSVSQRISDPRYQVLDECGKAVRVSDSYRQAVADLLADHLRRSAEGEQRDG